MGRLKKFKTVFIVFSILYIILGAMLIIWPEISVIAICKLFGTLTLALGIVRIIGYFTKDEFEIPYQLDLVHGLLNIIFGSFMLSSPKTIITVLPIVLGISIIIDSMLKVRLAIDLKRMQYQKWWLGFTLAVITAALGTLLLFNPFAGGIMLIIYIGISLAVDGIVNLWVLIYLSRALKSENLFF